MNTYNIKFKYLTDLRIRRNLAFKISCIWSICELQLQGILASPETPFITSNWDFDHKKILPPWDKLKSLIIDIFFIANEKRIPIRRSHPGNLQLILLINHYKKKKLENNFKSFYERRQIKKMSKISKKYISYWTIMYDYIQQTL